MTKKAWIFIGLTFFFNYLLAFFYFALGGKLLTLAGFTLTIIYMFIPMIVAIAVQKLFYKEPLKQPFGISFKLNRWFLVAWLLPLILAFGALGVSLFFPGVEYSPNFTRLFERYKSIIPQEQLKEIEGRASSFPVNSIWIGLLMGLIAGPTINAVAGFGEELGWRGLLQREFAYMGFWKSSALIGIIWGVWHAPIILQGHNYPQHSIIGVGMMIIFTLLLAPIFAYIRLKAKSVIAAAILHGSLNGTAGLSVIAIKGGNDLTTGVAGLASFIILAIVNVGLLVYDRYFAKEPILKATP